MSFICRQLKKAGLLLCIIATCNFVYGQIPVKGKVISSEDNQGMTGVNIVIKGTGKGVISGTDGSYNISVSKADDILVFSFIGFKSQEITVGARIVINVTLEPDIVSIESVVVMGYSSKKRSEITSAVTTVTSDKLMDVTSNDIGTMLQGKVSGIQVINSSGAPGATSEIRIRGISSFSAPQGPLYVVDGIIGGKFDPNDVETITVLKDAGATGMYGSQANGGVVVVTTKKAKSDKTQFEFKAVTGMRRADHGHVKMMDSKTLI